MLEFGASFSSSVRPVAFVYREKLQSTEMLRAVLALHCCGPAGMSQEYFLISKWRKRLHEEKTSTKLMMLM